MASRQVQRRNLFQAEFTVYHGAQVPKELMKRKDRRKLARAYAAKAWKDCGR